MGHTKIVETFRMLLGTFGGNNRPRPKKKSSSLQDPIHKRRLGMHDHCLTSDKLKTMESKC